MHTENAYHIQDQQLEDVILPLHSQRETFTIYVADNIDRTEETLSGNDIIFAALYPIKLCFKIHYLLCVLKYFSPIVAFRVLLLN